MSSGYSNRIWQCPYFRWDKRQEVHCEGGVCRFDCRETYLGYVREFCSGEWRRCTLAQALSRQYEEEEP